MSSLRVAIIGGGIGGLSAAVALREIGAQVRVYEQARQLSEIGAGVALHHNSQRVLRGLGLGEHVGRFGTRLAEFRFYTPDGTVVSHETYAADAPPLGLHRADLVAILAGALPTGVVHAGHRCTHFTQNDGSVTVSFDTGLSVEADVVIAADGIHSALQRYVVDPAPPVFSGMVAYRGLIPAVHLPDWPQDLTMWGGGGRHLLVYPVRAGELLNYVGFVPADEQMRESWSAPGHPAMLAAEFAGWHPDTRRLLSHVRTTLKWGLYDREPLQRWADGRLTLLGDAAHPMLPHMGQGANQAIEDAMALATLLRGVSAVAVPETLIRFQTLRRERTARVQQAARANGTHFDSGVAVSLSQPWVQDYDVEAEARAAS